MGGPVVKAAWALRLQVEHARRLVGLRGLAEVQICLAGDNVWAAGPLLDEETDTRLRKIRGADRLSVDEQERVSRPGARVPIGRLPAGEWIGIREFFVPAAPTSMLAGVLHDRVPLCRVRSGREREPEALLTDRSTWLDHAAAASRVRLEPLRFAAAPDGRVLIVGRPLPPLRGTAFVRFGRVVVPSGWHWDPPVDERVLESLFGGEPDDLLVFRTDGGVDRIAAGDFVAIDGEERCSEAMTDRAYPAAATLYLRPPPDCFWRWEDDGRTAVWADGRSIAFREEIEAVFHRLAERGLPPLEAILLLLAACRDTWSEHRGRNTGMLAGILCYPVSTKLATAFDPRTEEERLAEEIDAEVIPLEAGSEPGERDGSTGPGPLLVRVLGMLDAINALPPEDRAGIAAIETLAAYVFDEIEIRGSRAEADRIVAIVQRGGAWTEPEPGTPGRMGRRRARHRLLTSLRALDQSRRTPSITSRALERFRRTGLETLPREAPIEVPPVERARALVDQLAEDEEYRSLSRLVKQLMATINLPRRLSDPDELPTGGFSDLSNRGEPDRLLLSELAQDDLTLMVRIALNEALYLRREAPPTSPSGRRVVLLDAGIRMWGVPRVLAAAYALAFAATAEPQFEFCAYRASERQLVTIDLLTREGLTRHLEALETAPHPGAALPAFMEQLDRPETGISEGVLITADEVLNDPEFLMRLYGGCEVPLYVATVNHEGDCRLFRVTAAGTRRLQQSRVELDDILTAPAPKPRPSTKITDEDLPALFHAEPFPFLLTHHVSWDSLRYADHRKYGAVTVTNDHRLMHWPRAGRGAETLYERFPTGPLHWFRVENSGTVRALVGGTPNSPFHLVAVDLNSAEVRIARVQTRQVPPLAAHVDGGILCLIYKESVEGIDLESGEQVSSLHIPLRVAWLQRRFFYRASEPRRYLALTVQDRRPKLEEFSPGITGRVGLGMPVAVFDCRSRESTLALRFDGKLVDLTVDWMHAIEIGRGNACRHVEVSGDGNRLAIHPGHSSPYHPRDSKWTCVEIDSEGCREVKNFGHARSFLAGIAYGIVQEHYPVRRKIRKISGVGVDREGRLLIAGGAREDRDRLKAVRLILDHPPGASESRPQIHWVTGPVRRADVKLFAVPRVANRPGYGYQMSRTNLPDGSRIWLDSRGLVHLSSSDPTLPEISLIMTRQPQLAAGWNSNGECYGPRFFLGDRTTVDAETFMEGILAFGRRVLRGAIG